MGFRPIKYPLIILSRSEDCVILSPTFYFTVHCQKIRGLFWKGTMSNVSVVFLNFIYKKLNYFTFHPTERVPFNKFLAIADVLKHNILIRYSESFRHIALYYKVNNICLIFNITVLFTKLPLP